LLAAASFYDSLTDNLISFRGFWTAVTSNRAELDPQSAILEEKESQPSVDDVTAQVKRILDGVSFGASPRRREMLRFLVEEALAGRGGRLKGVTVAQAVFGRDETFDQQSDPVVRIEARRLRTDLDSYYVDAGSEDPVRITIPKGGYLPHFAWQNQPMPPFPRETPAEAPTVRVAKAEPRGMRLTLAAALFAFGCLAVIGAGVFGMRGAEPNPEAARTPAIIVLPFETFGDNEDISLIASGVTEELIANLMLFQDFRVYSQSASFRLQANADPMALGRELGASFVISGVLQSENGQAHLRARLVDAQTGEVRWSGSFDRALDAGDLLGAQLDLAVSISTELGEPYGAVNDAIRQRMMTDTAPSLPSYACILRGYEYRRSFSEPLFAPAMDCLKQAVLRDPDYPDAWAMLGWLHLDAVRMGVAPDSEHAAEMAAAFDAASRAVDLDSGNHRALSALAAITFYKGDYAAAEALQREVLALNPHDPDILAQHGWRLAVRGDREGLDYLQRAVARSVNPPGWYYHLIAVYAYLDGDYARALTAAEKSSKSGSAVGLSLAAINQAKLGNMEAARDALVGMAEAWPLLGRDPAAAYRIHHATEPMIEALVEGLRFAGWAPPDDTKQ
jgi:TolB-like protein/Tfp pilus assembly protein PilF